MMEVTGFEIDLVELGVDTVDSEVEVGWIANMEEYFLVACYFSLLTT
ncbi:MAG TPA: hypothetical protein VE843_10435 [Ktedonobacteraceae bacterium]|nr:hypothetical protein [Ktedonobacteraceae bacterium]